MNGVRPLQSDRQTNPGRRYLATGVAIAVAIFALSGCMTSSGKAKVAAAADTEPAPTAAEQLAAALNAKAQASAHRPGGYRDPMVRTASGRQVPLMAAPGDASLMMASAAPSLPGSVANAPATIAGLVTQPTAVNANRTSIYSSATMPVAQIPDQANGVPLGSDAASASSQGITPILRSVYSAPVPMTQPAPSPLPEQQGIDIFPQEQSSQNVVPQGNQPKIRTAAAFTKPVSDATPSKIMPAPGLRTHTIDSKEALMVAHMAASKAQQGQDQGQNQGQNSASNHIQIMGTPVPKGMIPDISMTPGMAASLKQPIAFRPADKPAAGTANDDKAISGRLPVRF
jgi:hypothetical protein